MGRPSLCLETCSPEGAQVYLEFEAPVRPGFHLEIPRGKPALPNIQIPDRPSFHLKIVHRWGQVYLAFEGIGRLALPYCVHPGQTAHHHHTLGMLLGVGKQYYMYVKVSLITREQSFLLLTNKCTSWLET